MVAASEVERRVELGVQAHLRRPQAALQDPGLFKDRGAEVPAMVASLDTARGEVERLYARWQELEELARTLA